MITGPHPQNYVFDQSLKHPKLRMVYSNQNLADMEKECLVSWGYRLMCTAYVHVVGTVGTCGMYVHVVGTCGGYMWYVCTCGMYVHVNFTCSIY